MSRKPFVTIRKKSEFTLFDNRNKIYAQMISLKVNKTNEFFFKSTFFFIHSYFFSSIFVMSERLNFLQMQLSRAICEQFTLYMRSV